MLAITRPTLLLVVCSISFAQLAAEEKESVAPKKAEIAPSAEAKRVTAELAAALMEARATLKELGLEVDVSFISMSPREGEVDTIAGRVKLNMTGDEIEMVSRGLLRLLAMRVGVQLDSLSLTQKKSPRKSFGASGTTSTDVSLEMRLLPGGKSSGAELVRVVRALDATTKKKEADFNSLSIRRSPVGWKISVTLHGNEAVSAGWREIIGSVSDLFSSVAINSMSFQERRDELLMKFAMIVNDPIPVTDAK